MKLRRYLTSYYSYALSVIDILFVIKANPKWKKNKHVN